MGDENSLGIPWRYHELAKFYLEVARSSSNIPLGSSGARCDAAAALSDALSGCRGSFSARLRALTRDSDECFSGLRGLRISTSVSLTSRLSVRLSPRAVAADCFLECVVVELCRSFSPPMVPEGTRGRVEDVDGLCEAAVRLSAVEEALVLGRLREDMAAVTTLHRVFVDDACGALEREVSTNFPSFPRTRLLGTGGTSRLGLCADPLTTAG